MSTEHHASPEDNIIFLGSNEHLYITLSPVPLSVLAPLLMYNVTVRTLCTGEEKSNIFLQKHLRRKKSINEIGTSKVSSNKI